MKTRKVRNLLMALLCLAMAIPAAAASAGGEDISPRYVVLSKFEATLVVDNNGLCSCTGKSTSSPGYTVNLTMELQQKKGSAWDTIETWTGSGRTITLNENQYVLSGYDYRVKLSAEVKSSSGKVIEKPVAYSTVQHY